MSGLVEIISELVSGKQVGVDASNTWAASATANTLKTNTWKKPSWPHKNHAWTISNPSLITDLYWNLHNLETSFNGETRRSQILQSDIVIPKSTSLVIEDCEDAWNEISVANVTSGVDGTNKKVGTNSADIDIAAGVAAGTIVAAESMSAVNISTYTHIRFAILSTVDAAAGDLQLLLDNTAECASPVETLNIPALTADTWSWVMIPLANPTSDTAIISIGLKMVTDLGAVTINIDDVRVVNMSTKQKIVEGCFLSGNIEETKYNDTVLGAEDSFTSITRLREI
jgi:hypothetical protein